jgi:nucleotide-binding universal stress UspA family protein
MIKTILTGVTGNHGDAAALAAALAVARPFGAHINALHVRLDAATVAMAMATDAGTSGLTTGIIDRIEQDANERAAKAEANFKGFCAAAGLTIAGSPDAGRADAASAEWHVETGEEARWMAAYGTAADLVVAPRARGDEVTERSTLEALLLETGRPLLIPAAAAMPAAIERIAIAWKPTPQAARAVALALPFLARARLIVVLSVDEEVDRDDDSERLLRNLAWHGFVARSERVKPGPGGAAATLLAAARERADLLVMGGYGHSRVREWVFGGFTRQVLAEAPLPVLIAH